MPADERQDGQSDSDARDVRTPSELEHVICRLSAFRRGGRTEVVEATFTKLGFPDNVELCLNAGGMLESPSEAKWFIDRAVSFAPLDGNVVTQAAHLLYHHGFQTEACELADRAAHLLPFELSASLAYLGGMLARDGGALKKAEESFAAAFNDWPDERDHGFDYAVFLANQQRLVEALAIIDTALEHCPKDDSLLDLRRVLAAEVSR